MNLTTKLLNYQINIILANKKLEEITIEEPLIEWSLQFTSYKRNVLLIGINDLLKPLIYSRFCNEVYLYKCNIPELEYHVKLNEIYNIKIINDLTKIKDCTLIVIDNLIFDSGNVVILKLNNSLCSEKDILDVIERNNFPNIITKIHLDVKGYNVKNINGYPYYKLYSDHENFFSYLYQTKDPNNPEIINVMFLTIDDFLLFIEKSKIYDMERYFFTYLNFLEKLLNKKVEQNDRTQEKILKEKLIFLLINSSINKIFKNKIADILKHEYFLEEEFNFDKKNRFKDEFIFNNRKITVNARIKEDFIVVKNNILSEFKCYSIDGTLITLEKEYIPRHDLDFSFFKNKALNLNNNKMTNLLIHDHIFILTESDFKNIEIKKVMKVKSK